MSWVNDNVLDFFKEPRKEKHSTVHEDDRAVVNLIDPEITNGPWIAGGAVLNWYNNEPIDYSDIDVFFKDQKQFDITFGNLMKNHANMVYNSDNAITLHILVNNQTKRVQLIRKNWFQNAETVISKFDFTVCQLVTDGRNIVLGEHTAEHIKNKQLCLTDKEVNKDIIKRLIKYVTYGYAPDPKMVQSILDNTEDFNWTFNGTESDYDGAF
jgi:hypothetical protein